MQSTRQRFFGAVARLSIEHPVAVLIFAAILSIASILYTKARLEFHTGQDDLVTGTSRDSRNYLRFTHEFPDLDALIIVVRAEPSSNRAEAFADALAHTLNADHANVKSVFYRVDSGALSDSALLYLESDDLKKLSSQVREHRDFISAYGNDPSLTTFFRLVNQEANRAMTSEMADEILGASGDGKSSSKAATGEAGALDLSMLSAVVRGMNSLPDGSIASPWDGLSGRGNQSGVLRDGYVASDNGKYLLIHVVPGDGVKDGPDPVDVIQKEVDETRARFADVEAGMTGGPALSHAEETSTAHDIELASILAIASNALLVIIPFRGLFEPGFALIALLVGVAWSFGFTTLAVGHLNLLSAVFTSILAGIGINFPIHLMARYDESRRGGSTMRRGIELAVINTGAGVVASACIMALSFLMPMFTDFKGIAELGLISAAGLFLCLISAMVVFPSLLAMRDRNRKVKAAHLRIADDKRPSRLVVLFRRPWPILISACVSVAGIVVLGPRVGFDQNLLKLQAATSEAVRFEDKLLKDSGRSSWFAISLAESRAQADEMATKYSGLHEVSDSETISTYIPDNQREKMATLAELRPVVDSISIRAPGRPSDPVALGHELESLRFKLASAASRDSSGEIAQIADQLKRAISRLRDNPAAFADYESAIATDLRTKLDQFRRALSPAEVTEATLPPIIRERFIGKSGSYLVQIYPRGDVWDDAPLARFIGALRMVDRDVTGPPVQTWSIATIMRKGYERAAIFALLAVFIFVYLDFRDFRDTMLATIPLVFGGAWMLEIMGWLGWEFNLANLFAVPIIIGTGVDNGVNMLYRWREERHTGELILTKAVGKSVTVSSMTTIAGFAALIPATHRGISSLGWVLSLGVISILIATLVVLPAIFEIVGRRMHPAHDASARGSRRRIAATGSLGVIAIAALGALLIATPIDAAQANRAKAEALIQQAEQLVAQAHQADPLDTDKVKAAMAKLHEAIAADPRDDSAYIDLGFCYGLLREPESAVEMYRKATVLKPSPANFKELADIYLRTGDYENALMAANAGLQKDSCNAPLLNAKGMALHYLTRFDESKDALKKAVACDPSFEVARRNLEAIDAEAAKGTSKTKH